MKRNLKGTFLRTAFATALVLGVAPAVALAADGGEATPPPATVEATSAAPDEGAPHPEDPGALGLPDLPDADPAALTLSQAAAAVPLALPGTALPQANPGAGSFAVGPFTVWPVDGSTVTAADFDYNAAAKTLTVNTDEHFAIQNTDQAIAASGDEKGYLANPADVGIVIPAGKKAYMVMEGVSVKSAAPVDIKPTAELTIILGDGTKNKLNSTDEINAALHCPTGASLTIDDSVLNRASDGTLITPENGLVPYDCTLQNGKVVKKGDPLSALESANPGTLFSLCSTEANGAAIGGSYNGAKGAANYTKGEAGGNMTFNGGVIIATCGTNVQASSKNAAAAIGGGYYGNGTGQNEWITINGGRVTATGPFHGAGIGAGAAGTSGNIRINGGYVEAYGGDHSNGFGGACAAQDSSQYQIVLTGGTLLPNGSSSFYDVGAPNLQVQVTGGSLGNDGGAANFRFQGTAKNDGGQEVVMVEIDLTSDVGTEPYRITEWQLLADNVPYDYGAPAELDKGHLYLWLPKDVVENKQLSIGLSYQDTGNLNANGEPTTVSPEPFFRPAGPATSNGKLKRYVDFDMTAAMQVSMTKPYDGLPFPAFDIATTPIDTPETEGTDASGNPVYRKLTNPEHATYRYQPYDARNGSPIGEEQTTNTMVDEGITKLTVTSTQYADLPVFSESYWGHRAMGWYEITPVASKVAAVSAIWPDGTPTANEDWPTKRVSIDVDITSGDGTAKTCKAPTGSVQLYVDGVAVGSPVLIEIGKNARVTTDAEGREHTVLTHAFVAGSVMGPGADHEISAKYLPAINYLESASPEDDPEVPKAPVALKPDPGIEPETGVTKTVENLTHPGGPTQPGDRVRYTVTATNSKAGSMWDDVVVTDPLPACMELDENTVHVVNTTEGFDGAATKATSATALGQFSLSDPGIDGRPVLTVPVGEVWGSKNAVVTFECTIRADATITEDSTSELENVAFATGSRPDPEDPEGDPVPVDTDPSNPVTPGPGTGTPAPDDPAGPDDPPPGSGADPTPGDLSVTKAAENLTRDEGTACVGDTVRYTITLANTGTGTEWMDAVIRDDVPQGVDPRSGTLAMTLPDGTVKAVDDSAYDPVTRRLSVSAGRVWGGQTVVLVFEALLTDEALGADIGNVAVALGKPPSRWEPADTPHPAPGEPFDPPSGWEDFERVSDRIESNVAYPPQTSAEQPPLPDPAYRDPSDPVPGPITTGEPGPGGPDAPSPTPAPGTLTALPSTGDSLAAAPLALVAAAACALVLVALARRKACAR